MLEVAPNLHAGSEADFENMGKAQNDWAVVHICDGPPHGGGTGDCSGRLLRQGDRLILSMADAEDPADIPKELVDVALHFIGEHLPVGKDVLVYSQRGVSRSAGIVLLYLAVSRQLPGESLETAEAAFSNIYPSYAPAPGMRGFLAQNWSSYMNAGPSPLAHERLPC